VATYGRCRMNYYMHFVGNLVLFLAVKEFWKSVKNWQSYRHELVYYFFGTQYVLWCSYEAEHVQLTASRTSTTIGSSKRYSAVQRPYTPQYSNISMNQLNVAADRYVPVVCYTTNSNIRGEGHWMIGATLEFHMAK